MFAHKNRARINKNIWGWSSIKKIHVAPPLSVVNFFKKKDLNKRIDKIIDKINNYKLIKLLLLYLYFNKILLCPQRQTATTTTTHIGHSIHNLIMCLN